MEGIRMKEKKGHKCKINKCWQRTWLQSGVGPSNIKVPDDYSFFRQN